MDGLAQQVVNVPVSLDRATSIAAPDMRKQVKGRLDSVAVPSRQNPKQSAFVQGNLQAGNSVYSVSPKAQGGKVENKIDEMLDEVLIAEGGYQETKEDRGNIVRSDGTILGTNYGITPQVYAEYKRTSVDNLQPKDIKNITEQEAREIYKDKFYSRTRIQDIKDENLRANVLDMAINAGPRNAVKLLQKELGIKADGILGPETLKKLNSTGLDTNTYSDRRLDYYKGLTNSTKNEQISWARRAEKYKVKNPTKHKVSKGETLFNIAKKYNTTPENLAILNGITDPSNIPVDFNLKLK